MVSEALESLQKWIRVSRRTVEIHALLPDASLKLAGLDRIAQGIMPSLPAVLFRVNVAIERPIVLTIVLPKPGWISLQSC